MDFSSIKENFKKFISNPNTITFLLVIVLIVVVYVIYSNIVKSATNPVQIPYATQTIKPETEITADMFSTIDVSGTYITQVGGDVIKGAAAIINHRVSEGYTIYANSFFYTEAVSTEANIDTKSDFENIPDGYTIYPFDVNFHSTYGCSIMSGNYIDLYFKAKDDDGQVIFKLFVKSIQVAKVVDSSFNDVFTMTGETDSMQPAYIYFIVPIETYELLKKIELIGSNSIQLIIVPRNQGYSENPESTEIVSDYIKDFIESKSVIYSN